MERRQGRPATGSVRIAALVLATALALAACGGGSRGPATGTALLDQPAGDGAGVFVPGAISDLPKPGSAQPLSPPMQAGPDWTQSFRVVGLMPRDVIMFYEGALTGWGATAPAAATGGCKPEPRAADRCTYRGVWTTGTTTLEVTADPNDTVNGDNGADTELNLLLSGLK
jgi:hypothetical protein